MKELLIILFLISSLYFSCEKEDFNQVFSVFDGNKKTDVKISLSAAAKSTDIKYAKYLVQTDGIIRFSHSYGIVTGQQEPNGYDMSASFENSNAGIVKINNLIIEPTPGLSSNFVYRPSADEFQLLEENYNGKVLVALEGGNSDYNEFEQSLQMPEKFVSSKNLDFFTSKVFTYEVFNEITTSMPAVDRNKLNIDWNGDPENVNGVAIILEWQGSILNKNDVPEKTDAYKRNIEIIDDNGLYAFSGFASEGIPEKAIVNIRIVRGDIEIVDLGNKKVKVIGTTEIIFPAICLL